MVPLRYRLAHRFPNIYSRISPSLCLKISRFQCDIQQVRFQTTISDVPSSETSRHEPKLKITNALIIVDTVMHASSRVLSLDLLAQDYAELKANLQDISFMPFNFIQLKFLARAIELMGVASVRAVEELMQTSDRDTPRVVELVRSDFLRSYPEKLWPFFLRLSRVFINDTRAQFPPEPKNANLRILYTLVRLSRAEREAEASVIMLSVPETHQTLARILRVRVSLQNRRYKAAVGRLLADGGLQTLLPFACSMLLSDIECQSSEADEAINLIWARAPQLLPSGYLALLHSRIFFVSPIKSNQIITRLSNILAEASSRHRDLCVLELTLISLPLALKLTNSLIVSGHTPSTVIIARLLLECANQGLFAHGMRLINYAIANNMSKDITAEQFTFLISIRDDQEILSILNGFMVQRAAIPTDALAILLDHFSKEEKFETCDSILAVGLLQESWCAAWVSSCLEYCATQGKFKQVIQVLEDQRIEGLSEVRWHRFVTSAVKDCQDAANLARLIEVCETRFGEMPPSLLKDVFVRLVGSSDVGLIDQYLPRYSAVDAKLPIECIEELFGLYQGNFHQVIALYQDSSFSVSRHLSPHLYITIAQQLFENRTSTAAEFSVKIYQDIKSSGIPVSSELFLHLFSTLCLKSETIDLAIEFLWDTLEKSTTSNLFFTPALIEKIVYLLIMVNQPLECRKFLYRLLKHRQVTHYRMYTYLRWSRNPNFNSM